MLEALIAVSILAISLVIIIRSHMVALQAQVFAKDYALATLLLERELTEVIETGYFASDISKEKKLDKPYERFTFSLHTAPAGREEVLDKLNEVELTLAWKQGTKLHKLSVVTFVFDKE